MPKLYVKPNFFVVIYGLPITSLYKNSTSILRVSAFPEMTNFVYEKLYRYNHYCTSLSVVSVHPYATVYNIYS